MATVPAEGTGAPAPVARRGTSQTTILSIVAAVIAVIAAIGGAVYYAYRPVTLLVAVGPVNSDDYKVIQTFAQGFTRDNRYVRLRVVPTDGAVQSAVSLDAKHADLAVVRGDLKMPDSAQAVITLRKNLVVLWAPSGLLAAAGKTAKKTAAKGKGATKKIEKIEDLAGHRIGVVGRTPANVNLLRVILHQYGVPDDKVEVVQFSTNEVAEAVRTNKVDAFLAVGPAYSRITAEAVAASTREGGPPHFLAIDSADAIATNHAVYESTEIPAGTFGGSPPEPDDSVATIGFSHHLVARRGLSDTVVTALTRQLFAARQGLAAENPLVTKIEVPDTDKDAVLPAHPGAAAYVDGDVKTFMDRYSDLIWWGIMGVSALGSIGAWFAGYLKQDERTGNISLRDRLLQMLPLARNAASLDDLEALQTEADDILARTLHCFEDGAIDSSALAASHIVLQQLHSAIGDRRQVLLTAPLAIRPAAQLRG